MNFEKKVNKVYNFGDLDGSIPYIVELPNNMTDQKIFIAARNSKYELLAIKTAIITNKIVNVPLSVGSRVFAIPPIPQAWIKLMEKYETIECNIYSASKRKFGSFRYIIKYDD
jgi:hypothetical protein